ncbi:NDRG, alpha/beta hydrolase fold protein [Tanacetum coccineum]
MVFQRISSQDLTQRLCAPDCNVRRVILLWNVWSSKEVIVDMEVRGGSIVPDSDMVQSCRRVSAHRTVFLLKWSLDEMQSPYVLRYLEAVNGLPDITDGLKRLQCRTLIFVGENSPFHSMSLHMTSKLDRRFSALIEVCLRLSTLYIIF